MNPEAAGKHTFGDELVDRRRCHDARNSPAIAGWAVTDSFMNAPDQVDLPVNLPGILGPGEDGEWLSATWTTPLCFKQLVGDFFCCCVNQAILAFSASICWFNSVIWACCWRPSCSSCRAFSFQAASRLTARVCCARQKLACRRRSIDAL